jgi:hypothetical protein
MPSRFDYVKYDETAQEIQQAMKSRVMRLEEAIEILIEDTESKDLALRKLEEVYMWLGKGIRNDQIKRIGSAPLQEERKNG